MAGKMIELTLPTDNPVGGTPTEAGTPGHVEDHDRIRDILAVLVNGFVPDKLGDLADVNVDNLGDGVGAGFALVWDGDKFAAARLPVPFTGAITSGAVLRLQRPDGTFEDVTLPVTSGPPGDPGPAGRGIAMLTTGDNGTSRHLYVTYTDAPNAPVDLGQLPAGLPGADGTSGVDGRSLTSVAVNPAGRLIITLSDGTTVDAGNVVGPAGVGSFADSFRGEWSAQTTYAKNDIVTYMGDSYFSRIDSNLNHAPAENATSVQWALLALNGAKGDPGAQGPIGNTPVLSVGTITTLDPDTQASATFTGTPAAPVLNLSLPRGSAGVKGDRGLDGFQGAPGTPGAAGRSVVAFTLSATNALSVTYDDGNTVLVGTIATVKGEPGYGLPAGGIDGQVLLKDGPADFSYRWHDTTITGRIPWVPMPLAAGYVPMTFGFAPAYRVVGDTVQLRGILTRTNGVSFATSATVVASLPASAQPLQTGNVMGSGIGDNTAKVSLGTDGRIQVTAAASTTYVSFDNLSFPLNDTGAVGIMGPVGPPGPAGGPQGAPGIGFKAATVDQSTYHLLLVREDNTTIDAGYVRGTQGETGLTGATGTGVKGDTGASGAPGVTGPESWATPVVYSAATAYTATAPRSVVTYVGQTFVALKASTGVTPGTDSTTWLLIAAKGADSTGGAGITRSLVRGTAGGSTSVTLPVVPGLYAVRLVLVFRSTNTTAKSVTLAVTPTEGAALGQHQHMTQAYSVNGGGTQTTSSLIVQAASLAAGTAETVYTTSASVVAYQGITTESSLLVTAPGSVTFTFTSTNAGYILDAGTLVQVAMTP